MGPHHVRTVEHAGLRPALRAARAVDREDEARLRRWTTSSPSSPSSCCATTASSSACPTTATFISCTGTRSPSSGPTTRRSSRPSTATSRGAPDVEAVGRRHRVLPRLGLGREHQQALRRRRLLQALRQRLFVSLVAPALLLLRRPVLRRQHEAADQQRRRRAGARRDGQDDGLLPAGCPPLRVGGAEDDVRQGRGPAALLVDLHGQARRQPGGVGGRRQDGVRPRPRRQSTARPSTGRRSRRGMALASRCTRRRRKSP